MKRGEIIQVTVEDLAPDGRGVAGQRPPIYIKGALPGEVVNARLTRVRGGWAEALPESFITRSKMRVRPRCLHFGVCGGCEWQNIAYEHQLDLKRRLVENHLRARMGSETPPIDRPLGSEQIFFYRNKMEYSFERDEEGNLILGLHHEGRYDRVFDLAQCYLQSEGSNAIVKDVREFARSHFLTPYSVISHEGLLRLLVIREGKNTGETMVNLVTSSESFEGRDELVSLIMDNHPEVKSFILTLNPGKASVSRGIKEIVLAGESRISEKIDTLVLEMSAGSFFQPNPLQARRLYDLILNFAQLDGDETVLDLYCGIGSITLYLARYARYVTGIELAPESVDDAQRNAELNGIDNCRFIQGEIGKALPYLVRGSEGIDLAVVDPPRPGIGRKVARWLGELSPNRIIYVSCNPRSLAEDLRDICSFNYRIERVCPVDMFPHTCHIETVVKLTKSVPSPLSPRGTYGGG